MAGKNKGGLGKGLDALIFDNSTDEQSTAVMLPLSEIFPNRDQPRKIFDEEALAELTASIAEHGVIQPLLVRPVADGGYQIIAGERRWRAAHAAGLTEVPVLIKEITESEMTELALVENLQREDLNPIEEAEGLQTLVENYGLTQEEAAKRVGKSRPAVANTMRLLLLPKTVRTMITDGKLSAGHARALLALGDKEKISVIAKDVAEKGLSVRETERLVKFAIKDHAAKKPKKQSKRPVYYDEVELAVSQNLGRKAKIRLTGEDKGVFELEFFSREDLASLLELMSKE